MVSNHSIDTPWYTPKYLHCDWSNLSNDINKLFSIIYKSNVKLPALIES